MELITQAMGLANDIGMPGVVDYCAAAATRLSQLHTIRTKGTNRRGTPLPTPNAFEIAALTVGVMEESSQQGEQPSMAELLELLELVQAGMALLTRGRHSYNWQVTHWATDAAEEALALLSLATATDNPSELGGAPPQVGDMLPRLRNLLDEAATGVGVLVGIYPHRGRTSTSTRRTPLPRTRRDQNELYNTHAATPQMHFMSTRRNEHYDNFTLSWRGK